MAEAQGARTHRRSPLSWWRGHSLLLAIGVLVAALVLGAVGWARWLDARGRDWTVADVAYRSLQLLQLEGGDVPYPPVTLQLARFAAPLALALTAIGAGLVLLRERTERFRVRRSRDHVVVCGLGQRGLLLARSLTAQGTPVVVVEVDTDNDNVQSARDAGVLVLVGDATDPLTLGAARVDRATHVVACCADDGTNADIVVHAAQLSADRTANPLTCLAHVSDPELCLLLRAREVMGDARPGVHLDFFDVYERGARLLAREHLEAVLAEPRDLHVVVVGGGRLGTALIQRVAWIRHNTGRAREGMTITVVDRDGEEIVRRLLVRHPRLTEIGALEPVVVDVKSAAFERAEFLARDGAMPDAVLVCLDDVSCSVSAALVLRRRLGSSDTPIVVRTLRASGLPALVGAATPGTKDIRAFPLLDATCTPDLVLGGSFEQLARALHEHYLDDVRRAHAVKPGADVPWEELDEQLRESNRAAASDIGHKLRALGLTIGPLADWDAPAFRFPDDELEELARAEHERWTRERLALGWRMAPGDPDPAARTSPWLVPWDRLPEDVRDRDRNAVRAIPAVLAMAGLEIVPTQRGGGS